MPALLVRFLLVGLLSYIAGSAITPLLFTQSVTAQAKDTLSPFTLLFSGHPALRGRIRREAALPPMKTLLPCLGGFVAGVFVGAGLWLALILCAAGLAAWWFGREPDRPVSSLKHIANLGPRPRDKGR